jgi:hypothetical protein
MSRIRRHALVAAFVLLCVVCVWMLLVTDAEHAAASHAQPRLQVAILHTLPSESRALHKFLRRWIVAGGFSAPILVVDGSAAPWLNVTAFAHPSLRIDVMPRRAGGRPHSLAACYERFLQLADARFVAVLASEDLDRGMVPDFEPLVPLLEDHARLKRTQPRVLLFAPSRVDRFATYRAAEVDVTLPHVVPSFAAPQLRSTRFELRPIPFEDAQLLHAPCLDGASNASSASGVTCSPAAWVAPRFGFVARLESLRLTKAPPIIVGALLRESLALQWHSHNFSVLFCSNLHAEQCHARDAAAFDTKATAPPVSNTSALAVCLLRPDLGAIVFDTWAVDCNVGAACSNDAKARRALSADERGDSCVADAPVQAMYRVAPRFPTLLSCEQIKSIHDDLLERNALPFARGAHKAVFAASFERLPLVLKEVFFAYDSNDVDRADASDVESFQKTFERQVLDEYFYTFRWAPMPLRPNPFVMQIYGLCVGKQHKTQLMAAEGPLLPWSAAARSALPWFVRLQIAISLTRTIEFMHQHRVVLCGLNAEQVAVDVDLNAKLIDLDTLIEATSSKLRLGEGLACETDRDCVRVQAVRMTPYAFEDAPERSKMATTKSGAVVWTFKDPRSGSRGTSRHRSCMPRAVRCHCNQTSVCEGFDGASMLAASIDNMLRPLFDRQLFAATDDFHAGIDSTLAALETGACPSLKRIMASDATAALEALAQRFRATELLAQHRQAVHSMFIDIVDTFIESHRAKCSNKGEFRKCAA